MLYLVAAAVFIYSLIKDREKAYSVQKKTLFRIKGISTLT